MRNCMRYFLKNTVISMLLFLVIGSASAQSPQSLFGRHLYAGCDSDPDPGSRADIHCAGNRGCSNDRSLATQTNGSVNDPFPGALYPALGGSFQGLLERQSGWIWHQSGCPGPAILYHPVGWFGRRLSPPEGGYTKSVNRRNRPAVTRGGENARRTKRKFAKLRRSHRPPRRLRHTTQGYRDEFFKSVFVGIRDGLLDEIRC